MILKNPTKEDLAIVYRGAAYELKAGGELGHGVPDDVKVYWKNNIHAFLVLLDDKGKEVEEIQEPQPRSIAPEVAVEESAPVDEPAAEEPEAPVEEVVEAPVEDAPAKAPKKSTKKTAK